MIGKRSRSGLFLGESRSDHKWAEERLNRSLTLCFAAFSEIPVQLIKILHLRDRRGETALYRPDGVFSVRLFVPVLACRRGD